jgi:hypothetical protein
VSDRDEIEALIYEYARRIDDGDFAGIGELFSHGAITTLEGDVLAEGQVGVRQLYETTTRRYPDGDTFSHHVTTNVVVRVEGDHATAQSYFTVFQGAAIALQPIVAGRYEDRFERADGAWRFDRRAMDLRLVGDVSGHLLIDLP